MFNEIAAAVASPFPGSGEDALTVICCVDTKDAVMIMARRSANPFFFLIRMNLPFLINVTIIVPPGKNVQCWRRKFISAASVFLVLRFDFVKKLNLCGEYWEYIVEMLEKVEQEAFIESY